VGFYNDAESEACRRMKLIFDKTTADVCEIAVDDSTATYLIHSAITRIMKAYLVDTAGELIYLGILSRDELDRISPNWREDTGDPRYLVIDETSVEIVPAPTVDYTLKLEVYRTPLEEMFYPLDPVPDPAPDPLIVSPEIAPAHHRYLLHWALHRAYSRRDVAKADPGEAEKHERKFGRYFGFRSTADRGRKARTDRPHTNKVW